MVLAFSCSSDSQTKDGIPCIDIRKKYPLKEIILTDIADISYVHLSTENDDYLYKGGIHFVTENTIVVADYSSANILSNISAIKYVLMDADLVYFEFNALCDFINGSSLASTILASSFIIKELARIVDAKLDPFIKSQRRLNAKYTRSASINTYLVAEMLERLLSDNYKEEFKYAVKVAKQKANLYVNKRVPEGMNEEDILDYYRIGDIYRNE